MNIQVPDGLGDLLRDFTIACLLNQPRSIHDFAAEWFAKQRDAHRTQNVPMYIIVDDDDEAGEPDTLKLKHEHSKKPPSLTKNFQRRQSVAAERYDPEEDEKPTVLHKKTDEQKARLREAIKGILLFRCIDAENMENVVDAMFERKVEAGEKVIIQGEDGDNFYVIDSGSYAVLSNINGKPKQVHTFEQEGSFGELALMYNMPRSATVEALTNGTLWAMDRASFRSIVMKAAHKKRKLYEELLQSVPILASLEPHELTNLADGLCTKVYNENDLIIQEGAEADGLYFIEEGLVRITIKKDGMEAEVARASKGKYFGEAALVEKKPRTASVYAVNKVKVAFLERESFERLLGPCIDIMKRAMKQYQNK